MSKREKFPGLSPNCHYSNAREFVDIDYSDQLSDKDAEWLANFLDNYYKGRFKADDNLNPIKDRKEVWRRSHARRRDFMSGRFKSRVDTSGEEDLSLDIAALELWEQKKKLE